MLVSSGHAFRNDGRNVVFVIVQNVIEAIPLLMDSIPINVTMIAHIVIL